jgi:class 3 adenylate cyclase/predicted ATPase
MTFDEVLAQIQELLQREQRVSYRGLKRRFALDDEYLEDLKEELIGAKRFAIDEDGRFLVWTGALPVQSSESIAQSFIQPRTVVSPQPPTPSLQHLAERRQLTVMFCDLVGSTALSAQLDPEDLREVVRAYQETCTTVIRRYDGHIAQHLGDGLLVYFGYPHAHEDDTQRAVRAGLEILTGLPPLNAQMSPTIKARLPHPVQVRIGIHTGLVVIGEIGSSEKREILALGETPNLAARIQGQANPDEVIISTATYRLIEGLFETEERGQPELKGVATPLTLYRVVNESEAHSRFEVVVRRGLTPLIGRDHEYGLLYERWQRVKDGAGQVVLLSGEPGIGKSRLVEALKATVESEGTRFLELRCSPYTQNSALAPVIEHLQRLLKFHGGDSPEEKLQKLMIGAHSPVPPQPEAIPLLAVLLSLPHPDGYPTLTLSPQKQKEKTQEALVAWLCAEAKQQAMMYAWEDLHWADPSTLELLTLFLQQVPTTQSLTVLTFRPEFSPPWGAHSYFSQLSLSRLGRTQVETMLEKVTSGKALPKEVIQQIVSKTDGVPLFVEELTKMVVESDLVTEVNGHYELTAPLPPLAIPSTLHDSLMARLDRLAPVREIAQIGATIGREFDYAVLHAVSPLTEDTLQQGLKQLVEAELVYQSGVPPQARYLFKHALVQDTAYQSLLKSRRQQLHQQVAQVLVEQFPETVETHPELVAHHYTEASLIEQAFPYWQQAGERATQRSAYVEAVAHLTRGLELLKTLPDTPEHAQQELFFQTILGRALTATKGFSAPEVEQAYARALKLCRRVEESPQLFGVLSGLYVFSHGRGEYRTTGLELAKQMMRLAQNLQEPNLLLRAHLSLGMNLYWGGEFASARVHVEQSLFLHDPHHPPPALYTVDNRVDCLVHLALTLWHLGYPDQALKKSQKALALATELFHPYTLALTLGFTGLFHLLRREWQDVRERAEAAIALSTEQGFPYWLASGMLRRGAALAEQGQVEEGIAQMQQGLAAYRATGAELPRIRLLPWLAAGYAKLGQVEEGVTLLAEALEMVDKTDERWNEAELYRIKGELTLQSKASLGQVKTGQDKSEDTDPRPLTPDPQTEAEGYFLKAIEIARKQQAKSLELRAATSLARLWQQQGKRLEAHNLLSEVYNWFTEGFDTKDLQEAKALLDSLESQKV